MKEEYPIHFICGMSRAGTTWMSHCLNMHKHCATFGETLFWGRIYIEPKDKGQYDQQSFESLISRISEIKLDSENADFGKLKPETLIKWSQDMPRDLLALGEKTPVSVFKKMCRIIVDSEGKSVVIEKTPHHVNWVPRINKALPDSRFVIMVREPYGFMKSYKYQGFQSGKRIRAIFEKQYHPIQAALVWRGYAKSILNVSKRYANKVKIVRNEHLIDHPKKVLLDVALFLDLPKDEMFTDVIPPRTNSSIMGNKKLKLDSADMFWLNLLAKKQIRELGYDLKSMPFDYFKIVFTLFKLPLWGWRTVLLLQKNSKCNIFIYILRWLK